MLPDWLSITPATTEKYNEIRETMRSFGMHTVCAEAHCPNTSECWSAGTATFMILGDVCTRGCRFCTVGKGTAGTNVDGREPAKLARVIQKWGLKYAVITSVCRDDLPDGGARHFADCISEIRKLVPGTLIEVLIPDFRGDGAALKTVVDAHPDVIGHNIETVARLSPSVRDRRADYRMSLDVLKGCKILDKSIYTKSALMLGMGESEQEVLSSFEDLRSVGTDFLAVGQYLRPSKKQLEVKEYVRPERFDELRKTALGLGFLNVASGPFVRSSYNASAYFKGRNGEK